MTAVFAVVKRLISSNKVSFILTAILVLCATTSRESEIALSNGNYTWLLAIMAPFIFVFYDYTKLIQLSASKKYYYLGCLASSAIFSLLISLLNTCFFVLIDPINRTQTVFNIMEICGWTVNGVFVAFVQQSVFLFLSMVFLCTLLSVQTFWYGWVADSVIVAIICIFTPIASLRPILVGFFKLIMFNSNAILHISICVLLSAAISMVWLLVLKRKTI